MAYRNILGTFKTRGNNEDNTKNLVTLGDLAQNNKILNIILNGSDTTNRVATVLIEEENGYKYMQMVKYGVYDFMDFTSEEDLKAYNNFSEYVKIFIGAYSNKFDLR